MSGGRKIGWRTVALAAACFFALPGLPASAQTDVAALASYLGADREQRLIEGAKKEGELTLYTSMQLESSAPLQKAFEEKYGVKVRAWRGSGKDILRRAITEAQANRNDLDIVESDGFALEALYRETLLELVKSPITPISSRRHCGRTGNGWARGSTFSPASTIPIW